ncbi:MAG: transporter substrate-binding protein [Rhodopila sp.]|jgi:peptide/nickel transport system substrate-binding protein|nr:transporter substrate-binding protein [Rhodopila sp.]
MPTRRRVLQSSLAALALPSIAKAASARVLKFIPQSDLAVIDPIWSTAYNARNHGYMVFDTLFGMDAQFRIQPQMVGGVQTEEDGHRWDLTLRDGLLFHDGEKVLARDCVASIKRWAARDGLGGLLMKATDELSAPDDRTIRFQLKKPFPRLPYALGKTSTPMCAMMPERLAKSDPFKQITELVGSGPFRFKADERVSGSQVVYERFDRYLPRPDGTPGWTAGPKIVSFDRVEWKTIPDEGTAAGAMQAGEIDWWEVPTDDLRPVLQKAGHIRVEIKDPTGVVGFLKMNCLQPPFDNPGVRRALLGAFDQEDFVTAIAGTDPKMWRTGVGVFCPGTELANDVGIELLTSPRDPARVKAMLKDAGYTGQTVAMMVPTDTPYRKAMGDVGVAALQGAGMHVDYQAVDWGTAVVRRENKGPIDKGGWSGLFTTLTGLDIQNPSGNAFRLSGETGWFGWASSPRIEGLRGEWLDAEDLPTQQRIGRDIQRQWWTDVPHIPIGQWFQPTAWRDNLDGMLDGFPVFWGLKRS